MASKVKHNFKESALALLRGDWCNRVARRVSYWMGCNGVDVTMPDTPSNNDPIKVGLNVPNAAQILAGEMLSKNLLGRMAGVPFSLTPVLNTAKTAVASLNVYLPTLDFDFGGVTYTVETGSGTGYVTRLDSNGPWYRINGFTTGDVYLVDTSTSSANRMKFATSAPTGDKAYIKLGTVTFNSSTSTASVAQYEHPMRGAVDFGGGDGGGGEGAPLLPLTLQAVVNSGKTAVSELRVYLPDTTVGFGRTDYPLRTGTSTGYLTAVTGAAGWYKINGITTGTIWLVDDSIQQTVNGVVVRTPRAKFATAALSTANRLNNLVGQVSYTSGAEAATIVQTEPLRKGWLGDCEGEHDGQTAIDITLTTNANDLAIFQQEGHHLNTDTWQRGVTGLAKVTVSGDNQTIAAVQDADGHQPLCGTKLRCFTRVIRAVDIDWFIYRELEFDKNGCLRSISAEKGVHGECNYAYS